MKQNLSKIKTLTIVLIQPSRYDDDGYLICYFRGVLPSNTLACLHSLTTEFADRWKEEKGIEIKIKLYDEVVDYVPFKRLAALNSGSNKVVAALVGVQSGHFARASDIAKKLTGLGIKTLIGGFHVSGIIALFGKPSPEIQELIDLGVTVVHGEVETRWENILNDVILGCEKPLYILTELPDISNTPMPRLKTGYMKKFAIPETGTLDCSRGCPFNCSFCTVVNVQGRKMRYRWAKSVLKTIRDNYAEGISHHFFTDDNFSRNPEWEKVYDGMIRMIEEEGMNLTFMMQVDTRCTDIKNFIEKASRAGCTQVFIGMESLNQKNLEAVKKNQNKVENYASMIEAWHKVGISTHVGYIIGFPFDTPESVRNDIQKLKSEIKVDQASFFMLTPLPGSMDHYNMVKTGKDMDPDLNNYDSFHAAMDHPLMSKDEWVALYNEAWESFYAFENMKDILNRSTRKTYWNIFINFLWYKNSILEPRHPMVAGFIRKKRRKDVRPGTPVHGWWEFNLMRIKEMTEGFLKRIDLYFELQELWLLTRKPDDPTFKFVADITSYLSEAKNSMKKITNLEEMGVIINSLKRKISGFYHAPILKGKALRRFNALIQDMNVFLDGIALNEQSDRNRNRFVSYLNSTIHQIEEIAIKHVARQRRIKKSWILAMQQFKRGEFLHLIVSIPRILLIAVKNFRLNLTFAYHLLNGF